LIDGLTLDFMDSLHESRRRFLRQEDALSFKTRLCKSQSVAVFPGATVCSMATVWKIQRRVLFHGASLWNKDRVSGARREPGKVEGKA
jgi:hypothetical protein